MRFSVVAWHVMGEFATVVPPVCEQRDQCQCCCYRGGSGARVFLERVARAGTSPRRGASIPALPLVITEKPRPLPSMLDCRTVSHSLHVPALLGLFPVAPVTSGARSSPLPLLRAPARPLSERFPAPTLPHGRVRCPHGAPDTCRRAHALAADQTLRHIRASGRCLLRCR